MAASPYVYIGDIVYNCEYQLGQNFSLIPLQAILTAYRAANPSLMANLLTELDILDQLRALTGCTVATGIDVNCYPRGDATALCFDLDGIPLP